MTVTTSEPLTEIRKSLATGNGRIQIVNLLLGPARRGVQVWEGRKKVGPLLLPPANGTLADLLRTIGNVVEEDERTLGEPQM